MGSSLMMLDQAFRKEVINTLRSMGFGLCSRAIILCVVVNYLAKRTMNRASISK